MHSRNALGTEARNTVMKGGSLVGADDDLGNEAGFPNQLQAVAVPGFQRSHHHFMVLPCKEHRWLAAVLMHTAHQLPPHRSQITISLLLDLLFCV
jgi:hypothetical protein